MELNVEENKFVLYGNTYEERNIIKQFRFHWDGYNWNTERVDKAEKLANHFDIDIKCDLVEDFYTGYKTAQEYNFDGDKIEEEIETIIAEFKYSLGGNYDIENIEEGMRDVEENTNLSELNKAKWYSYKKFKEAVDSKGKTIVTIYSWTDDTYNIKEDLKKLGFKWDGSHWFKKGIENANDIIDNIDWNKYRVSWKNRIITTGGK